MFKAKGKLNILRDNKVREVVYDNGKLSGDDSLIFNLRKSLELAEEKGGSLGHVRYKAKKPYISDPMAVLIMIDKICSDAEFTGDVPTLKGKGGLFL
ncbi:hypothetical protein [Bacillus cereus]|uniref:hypothetical protein n=1 Tax=Bacillus cereus TaxID=1396 RepID=UPI0014447F58|nr:hypothetical protein [Bacillus cereus]NKW87073.1 hypothetical protein [Bacillus cereus]